MDLDPNRNNSWFSHIIFSSNLQNWNSDQVQFWLTLDFWIYNIKSFDSSYATDFACDPTEPLESIGKLISMKLIRIFV